MIYFYSEFVTISLTPRTGPRGLVKLIYRLPLLIYRLGMSWLIADFVLLLTTKGRKTGKPRATPLAYHLDLSSGTYFICAGWPESAQWYRNFVADPRVGVQVGRRRFECVARLASREDAEWLFAEFNRSNPFSARLWQKLTGEKNEATDWRPRLLAERFPVLALQPGRIN